MEETTEKQVPKQLQPMVEMNQEPLTLNKKTILETVKNFLK